MSTKRNSPSTEKKSKKEGAANGGAPFARLNELMTALNEETPDSTIVLALAADTENGILHSTLKGKGLDIANLLASVIFSKDEKTQQLAPLLIHLPFLVCESCEIPDLQRSLYDEIKAAYQTLVEALEPSDPNAN